MTTETDRARAGRPRGIGRIDPALRDAAASLAVDEFRAESLPAERERAYLIAADRAAAVDAGHVEIEDRAIPGPAGQQLVLRLYRGTSTSAAPLVVYADGGRVRFGGTGLGGLAGERRVAHADAAQVVCRLDRIELGDQPVPVHLGQRHQHAARRHRRIRPFLAGGRLIDEDQHDRRIRVQL
jgi:hypothetical protein